MSEADHPPQPDDPQTVLPAPPDPDEPGGPEPRPSTWARRPPVITEIKSLFDQDRADELPAPALPDAAAPPDRPLWADSEGAEPQDVEPARPEPAEAELERAEPEEAELERIGPQAAEPEAAATEVVDPEVVDPALAQERAPALSAASSAAVRWARDSLAVLGELDGRRMDRQAVDVNEHRIGKLEPEWNVPRRIRSFVILVVLTLFVAAVIAAVLAIAVEVLSVAVNHAVSKSAGA